MRLPEDPAAVPTRPARVHAEPVVNAARALVKGSAPDGLFGPDVQIALRGYRAGMIDRTALLDALTAAYRRLGRDATLFDSRGNLMKM
jgi:hypothetical protein